MSENAVVNACIRWLFFNGCFCWRNNSGGWKPTGSKRVIRYGKTGSSDIIGVTPNGRFVGVECKYGDGELSSHQEEFRRSIIAKNGIYIVARDSVQALEDNKHIILSEYW